MIFLENTREFPGIIANTGVKLWWNVCLSVLHWYFLRLRKSDKWTCFTVPAVLLTLATSLTLSFHTMPPHAYPQCLLTPFSPSKPACAVTIGKELSKLRSCFQINSTKGPTSVTAMVNYSAGIKNCNFSWFQQLISSSVLWEFHLVLYR